MSEMAKTPKPPYYAVILNSLLVENADGYGEMAGRMVDLATTQPGFLGIDSAREDLDITVSYSSDIESIKKWKSNVEHQEAQRLGREKWYASFKLRVSKIERDYGI